MDNTKEFKTPNGYIVTIKTRINYGENKIIRQALFDAIMLDFNPGKMDNPNVPDEEKAHFKEIPLSALSAGNEVALKVLCTKVTDAQGVDLGDPVQALNSMPVEDGDAVMDEIDATYKSISPNKKKLPV